MARISDSPDAPHSWRLPHGSIELPGNIGKAWLDEDERPVGNGGCR